MRSRYHPFHPARFGFWSQPKSKPGTTDLINTLNAGGRLRLLYSPERLQGEFIIRAYRFTPPTGSLESPKRLLLLFAAFEIMGQFRKIKRIKSSCFIFIWAFSILQTIGLYRPEKEFLSPTGKQFNLTPYLHQSADTVLPTR